MCCFIELTGRGLIRELASAFANQWPLQAGDSARELAQRLAQSPGSIDLATRHGLALLRERRPAAALRQFRELRARAPQTAMVHIGLALAADALQQRELACESLLTAGSLDPADPAPIFCLGVLAERAADRAAALHHYHHALARCSGLRNAHERLAAIALREGAYEDALASYGQIADLEPDDVDCRLAVGMLRLAVGDVAGAVEAFHRALLVEPECEASDLHRISGPDENLSEAVHAAGQIAAEFPGVSEFQVQLGDLLVRAGRQEEALQAYEHAARLRPNYIEAAVKLGAQRLRLGNAPGAVLAFSRAAELTDRLLLAFCGLAVAQLRGGDRKAAAETLRLAINLEPNSRLLVCEAARLQATIHGWDNANPRGDRLLRSLVRRHRAQLADAPYDTGTRYRYALLLRQVDQPRRAAAELRKAINGSAGFAQARIKLALDMAERGAGDDAARLLGRVFTPQPRAITLHYELTTLFAASPDFEAALERHEAALTGQHGGRDTLRAGLMHALQQAGMIDAASANSAALERLVTRTTHSSAPAERWERSSKPTE